MTQPKVPYSYLHDQFKNREDLVDAVRQLSKTGQFTLGEPVEIFENRFAEMIGVKHAIGMNSGTDALVQILRALCIGEGDEVITAPNSFIATTGAIAVVGAIPVFVDVGDDYLIDVDKISTAITRKTKAIMPVHLTGNVADMHEIMRIAMNYNLLVVEDSAQAVDADIDGRKAGNWGIASGFSFHPLKNLNGWGDGGMVTTNTGWLADRLRLLRNHGLSDRDNCDFFAYNTRLHSLQAVILNKLLDEVPEISDRRARNASYYDDMLKDVDEVVTPVKSERVRHVYHLYIVQVERRGELMEFLDGHGIETKIHYPIPIHLQKAARYLRHKHGDFPVCEKQAEKILSLPVHQYLKKNQLSFVCKKIKEFYSKKK
ncbi:MAG: DegT/DnrJ/EryC1/StrS family aminotransferase [Candidatus Marinimicrobia bacterium]|nr:DegT/DnrJ/EryC1/StrS family aminotransferase [Candidatus Neomarinimicrobiota bacterium]